MNESGELCRVTDEKDWGVIEYPIEVPFFGLDLDRKPLRGEPQIINVRKKSLVCNTRTLGSRAESADPDSPPTVENRTVAGALVPSFWNTRAEVMSERELVNSKYP